MKVSSVHVLSNLFCLAILRPLLAFNWWVRSTLTNNGTDEGRNKTLMTKMYSFSLLQLSSIFVWVWDMALLLSHRTFGFPSRICLWGFLFLLLFLNFLFNLPLVTLHQALFESGWTYWSSRMLERNSRQSNGLGRANASIIPSQDEVEDKANVYLPRMFCLPDCKWVSTLWKEHCDHFLICYCGNEKHIRLRHFLFHILMSLTFGKCPLSGR